MRHARPSRILLALLVLANAARAQVRFVDRNAPAGGSGLAWASAFPELQSALTAAQVDPSITQIWVAAGTYRPSAGGNRAASFVLRNGLALFGGFAGNETRLEQRDPALHPTILDGDLLGDDGPGFVNYGDNSLHVVTGSGLDSSAVLDGFVVRGGSTAPGAGISCLGATPTLVNLVVRENHALGNNNEGGGLFVRLDAGQHMTVSECVFLDNRTTLGGGASVEANLGGEVFFVRCSFASNAATTGAGLALDGAHLGQPPMHAELEDCVFTDNQGTTGGALEYHSEDACILVARGSSFRSNRACTGAAIHSASEIGNDLFLERCSLAGNTQPGGCGSGAGGAIQTLRGSVTLLQCVSLDNGRGHVWSERGTRVRIERSTLQANTGSALVLLSSRSTAHLVDSILWGTQATQIEGSGVGSVSARHSDVRMNGVPLAGAGNLDIDPLFVDAAAGDLHLLPGSPCIDAGSRRPFPPPDGADFEGDSRLLDGDIDGRARMDMGADEFAPVHLEILGVPAPGNTLSVVTTGNPGLRALLMISTPGQRFLPGVGTFFLDPTSPVMEILNWSATPSTVPLLVRQGVPSGLYHFQELCVGRGVVLSNPVALQF
jgi:hypothetical protein